MFDMDWQSVFTAQRKKTASVLLCLSSCIIFLLSICCYLTYLPFPMKYVIGIDAGSTHTSAYLFTWNSGFTVLNRTQPTLLHEQICGNGIQSYKDDKIGMEKMLRNCFTNFPLKIGFVSQKIHVHLVATAGMRLFCLTDPKGCKDVIDSSAKALKSIMPTIVNKNISIVADGNLEGFYGWISVNGFYDTLKNESSSTLNSIDLGGSSTQIALEVKEADPHILPENKFTKRFFKNNRTVFSQTFLCYGTEAAALVFELNLIIDHIKQSKPGKIVDNPCYATDHTYPFKLYEDKKPCYEDMDLPKDLVGYTFKGSANISECKKKMTSIFFPEKSCKFPPCIMNGTHIPQSYKTSTFMAFSAFSYGAKAVDLRGNGSFAVYESLINEICSSHKPENVNITKRCFKLIYGTRLVIDGYKLNPKNVFVVPLEHDMNWVWGMVSIVGSQIPPEVQQKVLGLVDLSICFVVSLISLIAGIVLYRLYLNSPIDNYRPLEP